MPLSQALVALPYYWETDPGVVAQARNALELVLADGQDRRDPATAAADPVG